MRSIGGLVAGLAVAVLGGAGIEVYRNFEVCTAETRAAFVSFPHFDGVELDPDPDWYTPSDRCADRFSTTASADDVLDYYHRQLAAVGWRLYVWTPEDHAEISGCEGEPDCPEHETLQGLRDGLCYEVGTEHYPDLSRRPPPTGMPSVHPESKSVYVSVSPGSIPPGTESADVSVPQACSPWS